MAPGKTFSLRSLFLWCSVAAALLTVVGMGYRGVDWASGASWALLGALITMVCIGILYWVAHFLAHWIERVVPPTQRGFVPPPAGLLPVVESGSDKLPVPDGSNPETQP